MFQLSLTFPYSSHICFLSASHELLMFLKDVGFCIDLSSLPGAPFLPLLHLEMAISTRPSQVCSAASCSEKAFLLCLQQMQLITESSSPHYCTS